MSSPIIGTQGTSETTPRQKLGGHTDRANIPSSIVGTQDTSGITPRQKFEGHTEFITSVIHLPGGQRIMTCSEDGSLRVWDLKSGKQIGEDLRDGKSRVRMIALSPDGKKVVSGSRDGVVRLWDIETGKVVEKWTGHTKEVWSVCWSRDGRRVLSGSLDGTARQWDAEKHGDSILAPIKTGHGEVRVAVYSPDTTLIATAGLGESSAAKECPVKIWDAKTGELVATLKGHTDWVGCLAWTADGKTLNSGSDDNSIRKWSTTTWKQIALLEGHTQYVTDIATSPNGRILASSSYDKTVRLWNLDNGQPISSPLNHAGQVLSVSFSADGKLLATGCGFYGDRNAAYIWDVSAIVKKAGLDELLLDVNSDKSVLDATKRPVRQPIKVSRRVPQGFFGEQPHRAHSSARSNAHDTQPRVRLFHRARNLLSSRPSGAQIEPREPVVDVPYAKGKQNASAREKRRPILLNPKKAAGPSPPPNSNATQQSNGAAQAQSSSQSQAQAAISTSSTTPPVIFTTASSTNPHMSQDHFPSFEGAWARLSQVAVKSAEYDSRERQPHPKCLEGTRVGLLNHIHEILDNREESRLIWLHGTAGVGKSAVAFTVAERMKGLKMTEDTNIEKRLGGSFFLSRKHTDRCTTGYFFATLVYQLASNFLSIQEDSLRDQMEALFLQPLRRLQFRLRGCQPLTFVVDALDECTSEPELVDLILFLARALREPDLPVAHILLTSRTESHICKAFQKAEVRPLVCEIPVKTSGPGEGVTAIISLDGEDVDNDIYVFLQHSFREMGSYHPDFPQPSRDQLARLASRAGRRFIVASTMMMFIDDEDDDPRDRPQLMLELTSELLPGTEVYKLYDSILSTCTNPKRAYMHLSIVAALADPLPMSQISKLLGPGLGRDVETVLMQLRSVMDIPTDWQLPLPDTPSPHSLLAFSSFQLMVKEIPGSTALLDALSELKGQSRAVQASRPPGD
ncbi:quinon protein alcohol dehydrogenase-like superfamily [Suillus lakei]|nr:quinon protein alcohol dehydrogenase-like superfamily [Suillus lakei]